MNTVQCNTTAERKRIYNNIYSHHDTRLQLLCDFEVAVHNGMTPKDIHIYSAHSFNVCNGQWPSVKRTK